MSDVVAELPHIRTPASFCRQKCHHLEESFICIALRECVSVKRLMGRMRRWEELYVRHLTDESFLAWELDCPH